MRVNFFFSSFIWQFQFQFILIVNFTILSMDEFHTYSAVFSSVFCCWPRLKYRDKNQKRKNKPHRFGRIEMSCQAANTLCESNMCVCARVYRSGFKWNRLNWSGHAFAFEKKLPAEWIVYRGNDTIHSHHELRHTLTLSMFMLALRSIYIVESKRP